MKLYVWYCIETDELVLANRKKYPKSSRTTLQLFSNTYDGYWRGLTIITGSVFTHIGDL